MLSQAGPWGTAWRRRRRVGALRRTQSAPAASRWLSCCLVCSALLAAVPAGAVELPQPPGTPPAALQIRIELSSNAIQFYQDGRPGLIPQHQAVELRVTCLARSWSVFAQASPLVKLPRRDQIGPERLFIRSNATLPQPDVGAGQGFVPLDEAVLVAEGPPPVYTTPLDFRLLTTWADTPGIYTGDIQFTAIVRP